MNNKWIIGWLCLTLMVCACTRDEERQEPQPPRTTGKTISRQVCLQPQPLQTTVGEGTTRAGASVPLDSYESRIGSILIYQFGGTADNSVLIKEGLQMYDDISVNNTFTFEFEQLEGGGETTVCILANHYSENTPEVGTTTLKEFREMGFVGCVISLGDVFESGEGVPMYGWQNFDPTQNDPAPFSMKCTHAKVLLTYDTPPGFDLPNPYINVYNCPQVMPQAEATPGDADQRPANLQFEDRENLIYYDRPKNTFAIYLPENLAGRIASIGNELDRNVNKVPADRNITSFTLNFGEYSKKPTTVIDPIDTLSLGSVAYRFYPGENSSTDFNIVRGHLYNVHLKIRGTSTIKDKRVELNTANCYVVKDKTKHHRFCAAVMGNGAPTYNASNDIVITPSTLAPVSAKVIWEQSDPTGSNNKVGDVVKDITLKDGFITFLPGGSHGNALIGAFDINNTLIWSWHIWCPETDIVDQEYALSSKTFFVMPLNLGAFHNKENDPGSYGLLYQWGRKDPFPGATSVGMANQATLTNACLTQNGYSFGTEAVVAKLIQAIQSPTTYYYDAFGLNNNTCDWLDYSQRSPHLWGCTDPDNNSSRDVYTKTIYDPCPPGYVVPPYNSIADALQPEKETDNGVEFTTGVAGVMARYPYTSYWNSGQGFTNSSGAVYWLSSPSNQDPTMGDCGRVEDGSMGIDNYTFRSDLGNVRCIREPK